MTVVDLRILCLKGSQIVPYIPDLAKLRLDVFHEYPYLYAGDMEYEINYLKTYIESPESIMVVILDDGKVIGASTAIPLEYETAECQKPFFDNNIKIQDVFYLGESFCYLLIVGEGFISTFSKKES